MTANPLMNAATARRGTVTREMLEDLAASLNRCGFVRDGKPYVVREVDGTAILDR